MLQVKKKEMLHVSSRCVPGCVGVVVVFQVANGVRTEQRVLLVQKELQLGVKRVL